MHDAFLGAFSLPEDGKEAITYSEYSLDAVAVVLTRFGALSAW